MKFDDVFLTVICPRLDEYKACWMNEPNIKVVENKKERLFEELMKEVGEVEDLDIREYLLGQFFQIEARWPRPSPVLSTN